MSIIRCEAVLEDLINLSSYIAQDSLEMADRFLDAVEESFEELARMPQMGSLRDYRNPQLHGIRMWRVKGFPRHLIFYRVLEEDIEIVRVLHGARDIEVLFADEE